MIEEPSTTTSVSVNLDTTTAINDEDVEERPQQPRLRRNPTTESETSNSSSSSSIVRNGSDISPPPPYDTVAEDITKETEALAAGVEFDDLIFKKKSKRKRKRNNNAENNAADSDDELIRLDEDQHEQEARLINLLTPDEVEAEVEVSASLRSTSIEITSNGSSRRGSDNNSTQLV